jgi:hypothetical protein
MAEGAQTFTLFSRSMAEKSVKFTSPLAFSKFSLFENLPFSSRDRVTLSYQPEESRKYAQCGQ